MPPVTAETQPERVRWHTQSLRLTAFIKGPEASMLVRDWWNVVAGAPPVQVIENPLEGSVEVLGAYADTPLHMKAQRDRLDITRLLAPPNAEVETFPHLGEVIPSFVEANNSVARLGRLPTASETGPRRYIDPAFLRPRRLPLRAGRLPADRRHAANCS